MNPGENSISRHKSTPARQESTKSVVESPVFDIIPRTRVRPSASSRPVIASTQPAVADTTMRQAMPGPRLNLGQLGGAQSGGQLDVGDDTTVSKEKVMPEEKGVLVSDLMAKKQAAEAAQEPKSVESPAPELVSSVAATKEPEEAAKTEELTMVHERIIQPPKDIGTGEGEAVAAAKEDAPTEDSAPAPADDSLEAALEGDDKPREQTDELKDAIKDMDSNSLRHHELYEGKPVIVVHKHHGGKHPALAWTLWFLLCLVLALAAVNLLLDAGVITTDYAIPQTDFL